jgi:hypothetical protein
VSQAPEEANAGGAADPPLAANDSRHGNDVIGVGGMAHAKKEAEERHRDKLRHVPSAPL